MANNESFLENLETHYMNQLACINKSNFLPLKISRDIEEYMMMNTC